MEFDRKYYQALFKKKVERNILENHRYDFFSAAKMSERSDVNLEKHLVLDHFQSAKSRLKKMVYIFQVWKNVKKSVPLKIVNLYHFRIMNADKYFEMRQKLAAYRLTRAGERLQINLCIKQNKEIIVTLCFASEDWQLISAEREFFEDLMEEYLSPEGRYLKPHYQFTTVNKRYFNFDTITTFRVRRVTDG